MKIAPVIIDAAIKHTATIIFLHGLGDTGDNWLDEIENTREDYMKIVCPTADTISVTKNGGVEMPAWFDLYEAGSDPADDVEGVKDAVKYVHKLIEDEMKENISSDRIVVGGFSQGGSLALYAGLTFPKKLGGIVALASRIPASETLTPSMVTANKDIHILQCQGDVDPVVPLSSAEATAARLKEFSSNVDFRKYANIRHAAAKKEIEDMKVFLKKQLPPI